MNKKGFTLVELLAVVAILGILVIMAMPNVLESFTTARQNTFKTNAGKIVSAAQTDFISDKMDPTHVNTNKFVYTNIPGSSADDNLSLSATGGLTYCIKLNAFGEVYYFAATNNDTSISAGSDLTGDDLNKHFATPITAETLPAVTDGKATISSCE